MPSTVTMRARTIRGLVIVMLGAFALPTTASGDAAAQEAIAVPVDEAQLVRLERRAADVIVGNPSIADITVQNGELLVVTGKSFGITNVIVLDAAGEKILDQKVRVRTDPNRLVHLYKGDGRITYDCTKRCAPALVPGDSPEHFDTLAKSIQTKFGVAQSAARGDQGGR